MESINRSLILPRPRLIPSGNPSCSLALWKESRSRLLRRTVMWAKKGGWVSMGKGAVVVGSGGAFPQSHCNHLSSSPLLYWWMMIIIIIILLGNETTNFVCTYNGVGQKRAGVANKETAQFAALLSAGHMMRLMVVDSCHAGWFCCLYNIQFGALLQSCCWWYDINTAIVSSGSYGWAFHVWPLRRRVRWGKLWAFRFGSLCLCRIIQDLRLNCS